MSLALPLIGGRPVDPPVVLAPMAGITNRAFRRLCRESGAGIYVSEMITSRALLERNDETMDLIRFDADEAPRSLQLYGVDPAIVAAAVRMVVDRGPRRPRRPQLRLPGAQGHPQGRRIGAALEARPVPRRGRRGCGGGRRPGAGHRQDAHGHRRRPPDLPRGRACGRRGGRGLGRPARAHRRADVRRAGRLDGDRPPGRGARPARRPGPGQRRHLDRRRRAAHGRADRVRRSRGRPRLPGPAVAVRPARGGVRRRRRRRRSRPRARSWPSCAGTPCCWARCTATSARAAATSASTWPGTSRGSGWPSRSGPPWARSARWPELDDLLAGIDPDQPYPSVVAAGPRGRTSGQRRVALPDGLAGLLRAGCGARTSRPPRSASAAGSGHNRVRGPRHPPGRALPGDLPGVPAQPRAERAPGRRHRGPRADRRARGRRALPDADPPDRRGRPQGRAGQPVRDPRLPRESTRSSGRRRTSTRSSLPRTPPGSRS